MSTLVSERLPNDGGYYLPKLLKDANERLKKDGEHGKTCQLKKSGNSITLQFNFEGQQNKGCSCKYTLKGIERAEQIARLITSQLVANNFSWEWYNRLLRKKETNNSIQPKALKAMLEEYKKNWLSENRNLKNPRGQWYTNYSHIESFIECLTTDIGLNESVIKEIILRTKPDSHVRAKTLNALSNFCYFFEINDFNILINNFKKKNKIPKCNKYVPDDGEIELIYQSGFFPNKRIRKDYLYRYPQWQFLYSLLAIYGLRVHEAWNIANWDVAVKIKKNDWIVVEDFNEDESNIQNLGSDFIVPAILDPNNKDKILCVKHNTKTGYRMAFPISPNRKDWIKDFNLIQPLNLPDIPNPLGYHGQYNRCYICTTCVGNWFRRYDFSAHALRHAYNHRGHSLGINPTFLAQSLGHSLQVNSSIYLNTMPDSRKLENFKNAIEIQAKKLTRLEELEIENIQLKTHVENLERENELLKAQLQLIYSERSGNL